MAGGFTGVDLSQVPAPDVVEALDFEAIFSDMLADLMARAPEYSALVESDPAYKILQVAAYRELLLRQRVNDAGRAVMLAYAAGADLDNLGALFGLQRLVLDPGDPLSLPPVPPTIEGDADFRRRIQLSLEGFSTAGPRGAYIFHALSASGDVLDVSATSPEPGQILITVLSRSGDGSAPTETLNAVAAALNADDIRPLSDTITVASAVIVDYAIEATLYFYDGPDRAVVLARAEAAVAEYAEAQRRLSRDVTLSGVYAALHQPGVMRVDLVSPSANLVISPLEASRVSSILVTDGGVDV